MLIVFTTINSINVKTGLSMFKYGELHLRIQLDALLMFFFFWGGGGGDSRKYYVKQY